MGRDGSRGPQAAPLHFLPVNDSIPSPWRGVDIGDVGAEGADGFSQDAFTLRGAGADVWGAADALHFVYRPLDGDGVLVAHVVQQQNTDDWAKAGLMIRATLDADSANVFLFHAPGHGLVFQTRAAAGGDTGGTADRAGFSSTPWLRLTRAGDTLAGAASGTAKRGRTSGRPTSPC